MTMSRLLVCFVLMLGCGNSTSDAFADYSKAYTPVYERYSHLGLYHIQERIWNLGDAGKALQPPYDALKKHGDEVEALIVKANELAADGRSSGDSAKIRQATDMLATAATKLTAVAAERDALEAKLGPK